MLGAWRDALLGLGQVSERLWGIESKISPLDRQSWLLSGPSSGVLDCVPLVRVGGVGLVLGVRALWGRPLEACPVVFVHPATRETVTVADSMQELMPNWALVQLQDRWSQDWDRMAADAEAWDALQRCHGALGGNAEVLQGVRSALVDSELRSAGVREAEIDQAVLWPSRAAAILGDSPFANLLTVVSRVSHFEPRAVEPSKLRAFSRAGQMLALQNRELGPIQAVDAEQRRALAVAVLRGPVGSEAGYTGVAVCPSTVGAEIKGTGPAWSAARVLLEKDPEHAMDDPSVHASRVMLAVGPKEYDGRAHLDAAETLRAQGQGEQAIASLVSAAFFQAARYGVPPEMVEAAAALYRELGAESHEQALMAGLRQQLPE